MKKMSTIILAIAIAITFMPMPGGEAHAAKTKKPAKVTGVKVVAKTASSVTLKWKKGKRTTKYQLFMKKGSKFKKIKTTKNTKVTIKKLKAGTKYKFKVRGINGKKKGKYSKIIGVKTNKKSKGDKTSSGGDSSSAPANAPQIAKNLNVAPEGMGSVPADIKNAKMKEVKTNIPLEYECDENVNKFVFCFDKSTDFNNMTFNAREITPQKVKSFFGEFYKPSSVKIKSITFSPGDRHHNAAIRVKTDPFVSDIYFYATDKNGKVVYGKKLGWDYGETKHNIDSPMFAQAKGNNDVFGKMYDKMRKSIEKELWEGNNYTYQEKTDIIINYLNNYIFKQCSYSINDFGYWMPGLCNPVPGEINTEREMLSTKKYFLWLGVWGSMDCYAWSEDYASDIARDINPNVDLKIIKDTTVAQHFYLQATYANETVVRSDIYEGNWKLPYYTNQKGKMNDINEFRNLMKTDYWQNHITKYCPNWREFISVD